MSFSATNFVQQAQKNPSTHEVIESPKNNKKVGDFRKTINHFKTGLLRAPGQNPNEDDAEKDWRLQAIIEAYGSRQGKMRYGSPHFSRIMNDVLMRQSNTSLQKRAYLSPHNQDEKIQKFKGGDGTENLRLSSKYSNDEDKSPLD